MSSSQECAVDVVRMRKRSRRILAAVAFGALVVIVAGTIVALVVANRRRAGVRRRTADRT